MSATKSTTEFLNVDLDIYSRSSLEGLVRALGDKVSVLYLGRELQRYSAHLEIAGQPESADAAIRAFAKLLLALAPAERKLWDTATVRDFNIGVQVLNSKAKPLEIELAARTIHIVSSLKARIVITIYAPERLTAPRKQSS